MGGCCQSRDLNYKDSNQTVSLKDAGMIRDKYERQGQGHVFQFYDKMEYNEKQRLLRDAAQLNVEQINYLYETLIVYNKDPASTGDSPAKNGKLESIESNLVSDRAKLPPAELEELR